MLDELAAKKTQLATLLTFEPSDRAQWRTTVEQLEREANELERELVRRSTTLAEEKRLAHLTWAKERFGLVGQPSCIVEDSQVLQSDSHVWMFRSQSLLFDRQRPPEKRLGLGGLALASTTGVVSPVPQNGSSRHILRQRRNFP